MTERSKGSTATALKVAWYESAAFVNCSTVGPNRNLLDIPCHTRKAIPTTSQPTGIEFGRSCGPHSYLFRKDSCQDIYHCLRLRAVSERGTVLKAKPLGRLLKQTPS